MTLLKRLATSVVLLVPFFVVFYFAICMVGGAANGAMAGAQHPPDAYLAGQQAGANFLRQNMGIIVISLFVVSSVLSFALSFSGIFPWCKAPTEPPWL